MRNRTALLMGACILVFAAVLAVAIITKSKAERRRQFDSGVMAWKSDQAAVAVAKLRPLALSGDKLAQDALGWIYATGPRGVPRNDQLAIKWFRLSGPTIHKLGFDEDPAADDEFWAAVAYANGEQGTQKSDSDSLIWLQRSAQGGHPEAKSLLARVEDGEPVGSVLRR